MVQGSSLFDFWSLLLVSMSSIPSSQSLLLVELLERLDHLAEVASDDVVELVKIEVDAVVGNAVLREVVGADALAAVAGADECAALLGSFVVELLLLHLV